MTDEQRSVIVEKMSDEVKEMIMNVAAKTERPVSESMSDMTDGTPQSEFTILRSGEFEGLLCHHASGVAKILMLVGKNICVLKTLRSQMDLT